MYQKIYLLSGLPGSGKSFWTTNYIKNHPKTLVISRDDIRLALHNGKYIFEESLEPLIQEITQTTIIGLVESKRDFIIDETNGSKLHRHCLISDIRNNISFLTTKRKVKIIAVVFEEGNNLENRMKNDRGMTKDQWKNVIDKMKKYWEPVTGDEGFD